MASSRIDAQPAPITIDPLKVALVIIDMQRDFLEPGGFGESLGNDVSRLRTAIRPCRALLEAARKSKIVVIHTREGHRRCQTRPGPRSSAARRAGASAIAGPWGASWCAARPATTSSRSSIRCPRSR